MNQIPILYENDQILVINKPSGLPVQGGSGVSRSLDKAFSEQVGYKIYLVHRLDKDTSGLMIVAKNPKAAAVWTRLVGSKQVKKEYVALCTGTAPRHSGVIEEEIVQHGEKKHARTGYSVEKSWRREVGGQLVDFCVVRLRLDTGRMHQIRIHLAKIGIPIVGDDQHGNFSMNRLLRKEMRLRSLQLCSQTLILPVDGRLRTFEIEYSYEYR